MTSTIQGSTVYMVEDANPDIIRGRKVVIFGYGSQGHSHALNLKDSGIEVRVALRKGSSSRAKAIEAGLSVMEPVPASVWGDVLMFLVPDTEQFRLYEEIKHNVTPGKALVFAHGLNIHFGRIVPREGVDVIMVAPKGPGHLVREVYVGGGGVPMLIAVAQNATGQAEELALSYADAIGGTRAGVIVTDFRQETETDLFGEQNVLCGGMVQMIHMGFETLVGGGYDPVMAYFEVCHELKLIVDLIYREGPAGMLYSISDTAKWGCLENGPLVTAGMRELMQAALERIQSGEFAADWFSEDAAGRPEYTKRLQAARAHPIEEVGAQLRALMPFISAGHQKVADASGG